MEIPLIMLLFLGQILEPVLAMLDHSDDDKKGTTSSMVGGLAQNASASVPSSSSGNASRSATSAESNAVGLSGMAILTSSHNNADSSTFILLSISPSRVSSVTTFPATTATELQCENTLDMNETPARSHITTREDFPIQLITYGITTVVGTKTYSIGEVETLIETAVVPMTTTQKNCQGGAFPSCIILYSSIDVFYFLPTEWANGSSCISDPSLKEDITSAGARNFNSQLTGSTVINEDGFTFTSPSVYVRFSNLYAQQLVVPLETTDVQQYASPLGATYASLILPFAPQELYTDASPIMGPEGRLEYACNPDKDILNPTKLRYVDPAWSSCDIGGIDEASILEPDFLSPAATLIDVNLVDMKTTDPVSAVSPPPVPASITPHIFQPTKLPSEWISDYHTSKLPESKDDKAASVPDSSQIDPFHGDPHPKEPTKPPFVPEQQSLTSSLKPNIARLIASAVGLSLQDNSPILTPSKNNEGPPDASPALSTLPPISLLNPTQLLIGSMTIAPGAKPVVLNGHIIDFQLNSASATAGPTPAIIVDSSTLDINGLTNGINLAAASDDSVQGDDAAEPPTVSEGLSLGVSVLGPSQVVVDGITIMRGASPTTLAGGEVVSWEGNTGGEKLVVGDSTIDIGAIAAAALLTGTAALPRLVTLSSGVALTSGGVAVTNAGGHTLSYGAAGLVVDGETISLPAEMETIEPTITKLVEGVSQTGVATASFAVGKARKAAQTDCRWMIMWLGLVFGMLMWL